MPSRESLSLYWYLLRTFRNGVELARALHSRRPCGRAVLWSGGEILHPPTRLGLAETISEVWHREAYTFDGFYRPATGGVVVDGGANVGLFTIWTARQARGLRVLAIEPFDENFGYLETNLARVTGATTHRLALGSRFASGAMVRRGTRSLDHQVDGASPPSAEAPPRVIPLEGVIDLAATTRVAFLKLDIEGAERDLFDTASSAMLRCFGRIALEYHDHLRPGTLALLEERLSHTHRLAVYRSALAGCGVLRAWRS